MVRDFLLPSQGNNATTNRKKDSNFKGYDAFLKHFIVVKLCFDFKRKVAMRFDAFFCHF